MAMMKQHMPVLNDQEGACVPEGFPPVIDAHVHMFPQGVISAIHQWFDDNAYAIRYRMSASAIFDFLLARGVNHIIALQYAHKPGVARYLNRFMIESCRSYEGRVTAMASVFPGEDNDVAILKEAFESELKGLKLHTHVQCFDMTCKAMYRLYECCQSNGKPVMIHAGREPKSDAYRCDPHAICHAGKINQVLRDFPGLRLCVPHLGFDETTEYRNMIEKYDHLWLDTTMAITDYFPMKDPIDLARYRPDRLMYGSDFPLIPYAWDRELKVLGKAGLSHDALEKICFKNAVDFFRIENRLTT